MDLFSGTFGCFKPVGKNAVSHLGNDQETKEKIKVWVLRCSQTGHVHYVEAFNDFVDVLLGFMMLRTGALIRLNRELLPAMREADTSIGLSGLYDSFKRLEDSMLLVDKQILLDPHERLKVSEELQALGNGDFECCNVDCFKYLSGSRQICRRCTVATHFSCIACGGYFRENAHTSLCYTPWKPWRNHMTAAPILTRYTVIQSCPHTANKPKKQGYVREDIPFIITNELVITPLSTSTVSEVLKKCGAGSCEELECNELSIGTPEVLVMVGAALTSPTPLTDIFGKMCNKKTRVCSSGSGASYSQFRPREKTSTFGVLGGSLIKRPKSINSPAVHQCDKMSKFHDGDDSSITRPTSTPCLKLSPSKKTSKPHHRRNASSVKRPTSMIISSELASCEKMAREYDHDDSSIRRPMLLTSTTYSEVPPRDKMARPHDRNDSSIRRPTSLTSTTYSEVPSRDNTARPYERDDSSIRRPTSMCAVRLDPFQNMSKSRDHELDHDDLLVRRPKSFTSSELPLYKKTSKSYDSNESSITRQPSITKHAVMKLRDSPYQSPDQSPRESPRQALLQQQVQERKTVDKPTECTPRRSSFRRKCPQKQIPRKISFQQQPAADEAPEPQPNCLGCVPSPPRSPRPMVTESSLIELSNPAKTSQQPSVRQIKKENRKSGCTPSCSRRSTPESQSIDSEMTSPSRRPPVSTEHVLPRAPLTGRPSSICSIDDSGHVISQSPPNRSHSQSIINPLFQETSPSDSKSLSMSCQPATSPPSRAPSIIPDELLPWIARPFRIPSNVRTAASIVDTSYSPSKRHLRPDSFCKKSAGTGIASLRSIAAAFEQGSEFPSCSNSEVGSTPTDITEFSDDSTLY